MPIDGELIDNSLLSEVELTRFVRVSTRRQRRNPPAGTRERVPSEQVGDPKTSVAASESPRLINLVSLPLRAGFDLPPSLHFFYERI